jgi:hypothetical protein
MAIKGGTRSDTGLKPHTWKSGPDPVEHKKYRVWIQQRNQAQYREEAWRLSFEQWKELWSDLWDLRGRERGTYCMSRRDWSLPWDVDNTQVITREEHAKLQGQAQRAGWCSIARKKIRARKALNDKQTNS